MAYACMHAPRPILYMVQAIEHDTIQNIPHTFVMYQYQYRLFRFISFEVCNYSHFYKLPTF